MDIEQVTIFSIGHGGRNIDEFILLLKKYNIKYIIDVRSKPRSRFHPHFNKEALTQHLKSADIKYVFMGESLGGIPLDRSCYDNEGKVDYEKIKKKEFFLNGIDRIKTAYSKKIRVACMCSELAPCECHRSKLIGDFLEKIDIDIYHIDKKGDIKTQKEVMVEILDGGNYDLFPDSNKGLKSRKSYI